MWVAACCLTHGIPLATLNLKDYEGEMDCREMERDGRPGVEFSWEDNDECDPASGRGWAVLRKDGSLCGRIFFHLGDDSGFAAARETNESL
jgi:hypothetical protein